MGLELNSQKWWECSGDELRVMNLRRLNFVAQDDECHRCGGNQALIRKPFRISLIWFRIRAYSQDFEGTNSSVDVFEHSSSDLENIHIMRRH